MKYLDLLYHLLGGCSAISRSVVICMILFLPLSNAYRLYLHCCKLMFSLLVYFFFFFLYFLISFFSANKHHNSVTTLDLIFPYLPRLASCFSFYLLEILFIYPFGKQVFRSSSKLMISLFSFGKEREKLEI